MYLRKSTRRRTIRVGILVAALVVLTPRIELPAGPEFTALLNAVGLARPATSLDSQVG